MRPPVLLTRDAFREGVFARDGHKCVLCGAAAADAHHILERRLFTATHEKGGYFLDNGASVCGADHLRCERTQVSVEAVREAAGITRVILPDSLYEDQTYDKWGNVILSDGRRMRGDLFYDESVQKVLAEGGVLDLFTHLVKYPRTYHMPWSEGLNEDDRQWNASEFSALYAGKRVIVTEKMDGENTSMYRDYFHARSIDGRNHPSRSWAKGFWAQVCGDIPEGWRLLVENLYAQHSITYEALPSFVMGISMWNDRNVCLSWDDTLEWFELLGVQPMTVLYDGVYDETAIRRLYNSQRDWERSEGYVMRVANAFSYGQFRTSVAKFVRKGHVQTTKHNWQTQAVVPNKMRETIDG